MNARVTTGSEIAALPAGTVLIDATGDAWQVREEDVFVEGRPVDGTWYACATGDVRDVFTDPARLAGHYGPLTVAWQP